MSTTWHRVRGTGSPLGVRYYGPPVFPDGTGHVGVVGACSGDQVYLVPLFTGPGGAIDQLAVAIDGGSVSAHMGVYGAAHTRYIVPTGIITQTSVALTGGAFIVASIGLTAPANAIMWLGIQLAEARNMQRLSTAQGYATLGWETSSFERGYVGLVCSYAYASGLPTNINSAGFARVGPANPPPFIGVHYA